MLGAASGRAEERIGSGDLEFELALDSLCGARDDRRVDESAILEALLACLAAAGLPAQLQEFALYHPLVADNSRMATVLFEGAEPLCIELRSRHAVSGRWVLHAVARAGRDEPEPRRSDDTAASPVARGSRLHRDLTTLGLLADDPNHCVARIDVGAENGPGGLFARLRPRPVPYGLSLPSDALAVGLRLAAYLAGYRDEGEPGQIASVWVSAQPTDVPALVSAVPEVDDTWSVSVIDARGATMAHLRGVRFEHSVERHARLLEAYLSRVAEVARHALLFGDALDADANLLSLGATSLDAVRLASALHAALGSAPAIDRILVAPTLRTIAEHYAGGEDGTNDPSAAPFPAPARVASAHADSLSSAEQRLWYLERYADVGSAYNEAAAWHVVGPFDPAALERCLIALTARHRVLRTAFVEAGGRLSRQVVAAVPPQLDILDLRGRMATAAELDALLLERVSRPFDLARAPLLRTTVIRLEDDRSVLLLVAHHVICDGWSLRGVLARELAHFYRSGLASVSTAGEQPLPLQMADFAAWEQSLPVEQQAALVEWWTRELEGMPTFLDMPLDRPRPSQQRHRGAHERVDIPEPLAREIRALARGMGVTPFVVLLAAYQVLVHRYSGQERFVLGVPCSLREGGAQESIVGCLVNTVPIATELAPQQALSDVVTAAHRRVSRALARRGAPLERVVARLGCPRDPSHTALTQVAFSFDESSAGLLDLEGCRTERIELRPPTSKFDLMLQLSDEGGPLWARFEYDSEIFDARRIQAMARHYVAILAQLRSDASAAVGGEWMLAGCDLGALDGLGRGPDIAVADYDVRAPLDANLDRLGDVTAIVASGVAVSYAALGSEVARIAAALNSRLAPQDSFVAICASRSCEWVAAILATLRAGRAYLPIDPQTPRIRALALLEQIGVRTLLYAGRDCAWAREFQGTAIELSGGQGPAPVPRRPVAQGAPFWAITTSGSTGSPKTAAVNYRGVANLLGWYTGLLEITPRDRILAITSVGFDLTQKNLFAALMSGARLVLHGPTVFDPREVRELIEQQGVTVINCTPSMLYALVEHAGEAGWAQLGSLRAVVVGGETVDMSRLRPWLLSHLCAARLVNSYGPTECTDVCAAFEIPRTGVDDDAPIGGPIRNTDLRVLDARKARVPIGVPGELHICGIAVGNGYLAAHGDPEQRFAPLADGRVAYATGDIVRYGWDGQLRFVGRADTQIKIRGHRVSPDEVEAVVRSHPAIGDAAVVASEQRTGNALHAYFVATRELSPTELRTWLIERLPRYMVPAMLVPLPYLPMTRSGKVDRRALPVPKRVERAAPADALEAALLALWQQLLGVPELGVDDDFFEAGGHSMLAISAVDAIQSRFGVRCRVLDLFERPTVRLMGELLAAAR